MTGWPRAVAISLAAALVAVGCERGSRSDAGDAEQIERGGQLYGASCVQCHGGPTGGTISDVPPRHNQEGHTWHHSDCLLAEIIREGPAPRPEAPVDFPTMPAFGDQLTEDEISAILAFLKTWWTDEQRESQAEVTAAECATPGGP